MEIQSRKVWALIRTTFALSNLEEEAPDDGKLDILNAYHSNSSEYQAFISHKELKKEFGI